MDKDNTNETAEILRVMLRHETEQIHRRISWLGMFQGFLFAALAFAWDNGGSVIYLVATVGFTISMWVLCGSVGATLAINRLREHWRRLIPVDYDGPPSMGFYPEKYPWSAYTAPENLMSVAFGVAWIWVLVSK